MADCPGQKVRVGWDELPQQGGYSIWRCWAVCDGCGRVQAFESGPLVVSYLELAERMEQGVLTALGDFHLA